MSIHYRTAGDKAKRSFDETGFWTRDFERGLAAEDGKLSDAVAVSELDEHRSQISLLCVCSQMKLAVEESR
jgi:hypothetical protein